jgi:hypothetical protein
MYYGNTILALTALLVFAQTAGEVSWGQVVSSLGSLGSAGFTGWLAYHLITKWIPNLLDTFRSDVEKARQDYRADISAQRIHDASQNEIERNECERRHKESMAREEERHRELLARIDSTHRAVDNAQKSVDNSHLVIRSVDHGVRDIQQSRAWADETKKLQAKVGTTEMKGLEETQK